MCVRISLKEAQSLPYSHLVGQIQHAQVRLYFEAEGRQAGHAVLRPGELVEDDGVFRVQLLLLPTQRTQTERDR